MALGPANRRRCYRFTNFLLSLRFPPFSATCPTRDYEGIWKWAVGPCPTQEQAADVYNIPDFYVIFSWRSLAIGGIFSCRCSSRNANKCLSFMAHNQLDN